MKDLANLMDAVYEAFNNAQPGKPWAPVRQVIDNKEVLTTFCNKTVNLVCQRMGCNIFSRPTTQEPDGAMLANEMNAKARNASSGFRMLTNTAGAQALANLGALVLAFNSVDGGHGHVAVIIPGRLEYSGSWADAAPKVMNVGKDVFIGKKASFAFTREEMPEYFVWEGPS